MGRTGHRQPRTRRHAVVALVAVALIAGVTTAVLLLGRTRGDHGRRADPTVGPLADVDGVARACLLDSAVPSTSRLDEAAWTRLRALATRHAVLAQRSPLTGGVTTSRDQLRVESAIARGCTVVVVAGADWARTVASAARRHPSARFVVLAGAAATGRSNVTLLRYRPGAGPGAEFDAAVVG